MQKISFTVLLFISSLTLLASEGITKKNSIFEQDKKMLLKHITIFYSNDPCLDQAINAMNNAFAFANANISWCWQINTTPQGYADCSNFWIEWRRTTVANISATLVSCPEETGGGSQARQSH
jgi:hypothetical protein